MLFPSILIGVTLLLDVILMNVFPANFLTIGFIMTPALTLVSTALVVRDMKRLDGYLYASIVGMIYGAFIGSDFLLFGVVFFFSAFLVSLWKQHVFQSVVECFVVGVAVLFVKDVLVFIYASQWTMFNLTFMEWVVRYEASNLLSNLVASVGVIVLYYIERYWTKRKDGKTKRGEKIRWYELTR